MTSQTTLVEALAARSGLVCAVGAGGKKTTLYHLLEAHPGSVGLTSTVPMARFPSSLGTRQIIAPSDTIVEDVAAAARRYRKVAFALPEVKRARYDGVPLPLLKEIHALARFDLLLVKADGARMRWIKAPGENEPVLPDEPTTVIPVVSARAIGAALVEETVHRPDRVSSVTGVRPGEPLGPEHVARLIASPDGGLKNVGDATVVPVLNMVDGPEEEALAREAARRALELSDRFDRVVLTSRVRPDPLVAVVSR